MSPAPASLDDLIGDLFTRLERNHMCAVECEHRGMPYPPALGVPFTADDANALLRAAELRKQAQANGDRPKLSIV